jgi:hypothetical protein
MVLLGTINLVFNSVGQVIAHVPKLVNKDVLSGSYDVKLLTALLGVGDVLLRPLTALIDFRILLGGSGVELVSVLGETLFLGTDFGLVSELVFFELGLCDEEVVEGVLHGCEELFVVVDGGSVGVVLVINGGFKVSLDVLEHVDDLLNGVLISLSSELGKRLDLGKNASLHLSANSLR